MKLIDRSTHKPIYLQISDFMREDIQSGKLAPGDRVWSEHFIMDKFNVSRNSAQKAIDVLVNDGQVVRIQGKGTFVTHSLVTYGLHHFISFSEETKNKGFTPGSKVIEFSKQQPDLKIAQQLEIDQDNWVYKLERLRLANNQPISHQISYIPSNICPDMDQFDFQTLSLYAVMEGFYNLMLSWQAIVIKPIAANHQIAEWLGVSPATPLLLTESVAYLEDGRPIEYCLNTYLSDRYEFIVHSTRQKNSHFWRGIKEP